MKGMVSRGDGSVFPILFITYLLFLLRILREPRVRISENDQASKMMTAFFLNRSRLDTCRMDFGCFSGREPSGSIRCDTGPTYGKH